MKYEFVPKLVHNAYNIFDSVKLLNYLRLIYEIMNYEKVIISIFSIIIIQFIDNLGFKPLFSFQDYPSKDIL